MLIFVSIKIAFSVKPNDFLNFVNSLPEQEVKEDIAFNAKYY